MFIMVILLIKLAVSKRSKKKNMLEKNLKKSFGTIKEKSDGLPSKGRAKAISSIYRKNVEA